MPHESEICSVDDRTGVGNRQSFMRDISGVSHGKKPASRPVHGSQGGRNGAEDASRFVLERFCEEPSLVAPESRHVSRED